MSIMQMVYQAGLNNGLSPAQARAFTAEVGRENDFQPQYIFGEHRDSNRDNVGIISWNQGRRTNLYKYLKSKGISTKNGIERSQRALDAQMGFAIHEIKTNPSYKATKRMFLDNPNVDYRTAEKVLGKNFIRWDYAGNSLGANVKKHHAKRDKYYAQLGGTVKGGGAQQGITRPDAINIADLQALQRPEAISISTLQAQEPPPRPDVVSIADLQAQDPRPATVSILDLQAQYEQPQQTEQVPMQSIDRPQLLQVSSLRPDAVPSPTLPTLTIDERRTING